MYQVKSPLRHNRRAYEVGATVALSLDDAEPLLAAGAIEPFVEGASDNHDAGDEAVEVRRQHDRDTQDEIAVLRSTVGNLEITLAQREFELAAAIQERDAALEALNEKAATADKESASSHSAADSVQTANAGGEESSSSPASSDAAAEGADADSAGVNAALSTNRRRRG